MMQSGEASDTWHPLICGRDKMRSDVELVGNKGGPTRHKSRTEWRKRSADISWQKRGTHAERMKAREWTRAGEKLELKLARVADVRKRRARLEKKSGGAHFDMARWLRFGLVGRLLKLLIMLGFWAEIFLLFPLFRSSPTHLLYFRVQKL
ncbi:hypothetical protein TIFTF001_006038 [Ficus carica]|uniref:Uncharacterized protein n=1 Tax=Ficus carica TaxID=3494 RepID=A0AA88CVK9_FICCA|nr:hypothetical protein TIFTF001_006038 [Ficus carica]